MMRRAATLVALLAALAILRVAAQTAVLKITSPADGTYVMGPVRLAVTVEPLAVLPTIREVRWFADGRQVCTAATPPFTCEWDAGEKVGEHAIRAVAVLRSGDRLIATARTKPVEYAEAVDVDVVQVTAVVTDREGRFVTNLGAGDFKVYDDDKPQRITNFAAENIPLELVAAVDVSSSMKDALPAVKRHATSFLAQLQPADQVTLLGFNDNIFTLTRKATDAAERMKAVDRLAPWGSTALYDVLLRGIDILGRQTGRKALVVFTDGEDQGSHATINDVERRMQSSDVTLYMIGQGRGVTMDSLKKVMDRLSTPTGGRAIFTDSIDELHTAFADLLDELSNQYLLGYQSSNNRRDDAWRRIRVEVDGHHDVRARQGYRALAGK